MKKSIIRWDFFRNNVKRVVSFMAVVATLSYNDVKAQLLLYEPFDYPLGGSIKDKNGQGVPNGFSDPWRSNNATTPNIITSPSLPFFGLKTSGNYIIGWNNGGIGRRINIGGSQFTNYVDNGKLGKSGTTLYYSGLIRKEANNNSNAAVFYMNNGCCVSQTNISPKFAIGYFGNKSETGGVKYWTLYNHEYGNGTGDEFDRDNIGVYTKSNVEVVEGQTMFYVLKVEYGTPFSSNTTFSLYINPLPINGLPNTADVTYASNYNFVIESIAMEDNSSTNAYSVDELRIGATFADVAPPVVNVNGLSATGSNFELNSSNNYTVIVNPIVLPSNAGDLRVNWSSNKGAVAVVSSSTSTTLAGAATITGLANGVATITGTSVDGEYKTYVLVTVSGLQPPVFVESISSNVSSINFIGIGGTSTLGVSFTPANPTNQEVYFSTDNPNIAVVDQNGIVTAIGNDGDGFSNDGIRISKTNIRIRTDDGGKEISVPVEVKFPITGAIFKDNDNGTYTNNNELYLGFSPSEASNRQFRAISSNPAIVSVSVNNAYSIIYMNKRSNGTVTITAISLDNPNVSVSHEYTVTDQAGSPINLTSFNYSMTQRLFDNYSQLYNDVIVKNFVPSNATNLNTIWIKSVTDTIVQFSGNPANGLSSLKAPAIFTITGTSEDGNFTQSVELAIPPRSLSTLSENITLNIDNSNTLDYKKYITAAPSIGMLFNSITYSSSNPNIVSVNSTTGIVTGLEPGTAQITGMVDYTRFGGVVYTVTSTIEVVGTFPITSLTLSSVPALALNNTIDIAQFITILPSYATNKTLLWVSSNESILSVNSVTGMANGLSLGVVTITASTLDNSMLSSSFVVTVVSIPVTGISASSLTTSLGINSELNFNTMVSVLPLNASFKSVVYSSSNSSILSINSTTGVGTGLSNGVVTVTAVSVDNSSVKLDIEVTIFTPVTSVQVSSSVNSIINGETTQLSVEVLPANATDKSVTWSSSSIFVASVSGSGLVKANSVGVVTITASSVTNPNVSSSFILTINPVLASAISITGANTVLSGFRTLLSATVLPENAQNKNVVWSTSNASIATINGIGSVNGLSVGVVTITATSVGNPSVSGSFVVSVLPVGVTSISINGARNLTVGGVTTLTSTIAPVNATDKTLIWSSSNPAIASVGTSTGVVSALAAGSVTITATSVGSNSISASFELTVTGVIISTDEELNNIIQVYPNPVTDLLNVSADLDIKGIKVYNSLGQIMVENRNSASISFAGLPSGIYILMIETSSGISKKYIVK